MASSVLNRVKGQGADRVGIQYNTVGYKNICIAHVIQWSTRLESNNYVELDLVS